MWRKSLGQNITLANDTTPGMVTQADYDVWRSNFGAHVGAGSSSGGINGTSTAVPEPYAAGLITIGVLSLFVKRRRSA